jgi:pimeloyl-ACP methyl ester carboxylesterase/predicted glycosyltransferase
MVDRDGVGISWESYGRGDPTLLFMPTWSIIHARCWKMQTAEFARRHHVLTFDPRGNGGSDRPTTAAAYAEDEFAADALAVMDATETHSAVVIGFSLGAQRALVLAGEHPDRCRGLVLVGPSVALGEPADDGTAAMHFDVDFGVDEGWARYNRHSWRRDFEGFLQFFFEQAFSEPHSTKPIEDCVGWGRDTDPETLITAEVPPLSGARVRELCTRVRCPVLVVHGDQDAIVPHAVGVDAAALCGGRMVTFAGSGHCPHARDPARFNLTLRQFIDSLPGSGSSARRWTRARSRARRALFVSSPIGLGHARRDLAIADELRRLHPELEIDWLAQHPVTAVLHRHDERVHPLSSELASESAHMQSEASAHDLHCFQALRRMDEILLANFMVFLDAVRSEHYDLWIGDEAWDVDHYLHENPELKSAAYVFLTDFTGYLPMPDGGAHEAYLTADYNAEMIEQIARYPRIRDRAIFVGEPEDIVRDRFGPDLPLIRDWTEQHFSFSGYITGFDPVPLSELAALRREIGFGAQEKVCIVTVGGSGVGDDLLRRVIDSFPAARRLVPDLRPIVVAGPRIDPAGLTGAPDLEIRSYVPDLHLLLAGCDLAVIQGGLTTAMELTAQRRPFIYFPLRHHFEQRFHVHHRLQRYGAGVQMEYDQTTPDDFAAAIARHIGQEVDYRPVVTDGAARAARMIAELL